MQRLLQDATKLSGIEYNIDNLGDVYSAIHVIQGELGLTGVAAAEAEGTYTGSMQAMKAATENFFAQLSTGGDVTESLQIMIQSAVTFLSKNMLPMIGNIVKALPSALGTVTSEIVKTIRNIGIDGNVISAVVESASALFGALLENAPRFISLLHELLNNLGNALAEYDWASAAYGALEMLKSGLTAAAEALFGNGEDRGFIQFIFESIVSAIPELWEAGKSIIANILSGLASALPDMWTKVKEMASNAISNFNGGIGGFTEAGRNVIRKIEEGIRNIAPKIGQALVQFGKDAWELFKQIDWLALGKSVITLIIDGLKSIGSLLWDAVKSLGEKAGEFFKNIDWVELGRRIVTDIINGVVFLFVTLPNKMRELANQAWQAFRNIDWGELGRNIINGIVSGIRSIGSSIGNAITGLFRGAKQAAQQAIEAHSPSRVFRDEVGKWIPLGVAEGIERNAGAVRAAINDMAASAVTRIDTRMTVQPMRPAAVAAGGTVYNFGDITLDAKDLKDVMTLEGFVKVVKRAKRYSS